MSRTIPEIESEIMTGGIFAWQIANDPATLHIGIPSGQSRPALWMASGNKSVMLASFHGPAQAALTVRFLDTHSDTVQSVINHYAKEKGDGRST